MKNIKLFLQNRSIKAYSLAARVEQSADLHWQLLLLLIS